MVPSGGQISNNYKWRHLVAIFATIIILVPLHFCVLYFLNGYIFLHELSLTLKRSENDLITIFTELRNFTVMTNISV